MPESVGAAIILITSTIFPFALRSGCELEQPRARQAHAAAALRGQRVFLHVPKASFPIEISFRVFEKDPWLEAAGVAPDMSDRCGSFIRCWLTRLEGRGPQ